MFKHLGVAEAASSRTLEFKFRTEHWPECRDAAPSGRQNLKAGRGAELARPLHEKVKIPALGLRRDRLGPRPAAGTVAPDRTRAGSGSRAGSPSGGRGSQSRVVTVALPVSRYDHWQIVPVRVHGQST
jgi:hypothetical protein